MPRFCAQIVYKCNSNYAIICGRQMKRDLHAGRQAAIPFPPKKSLQIDGAIEQIYIEHWSSV